MSELSVRDLMPLWWAFFWRYFLFSSIASAFAVATVAFILGLLGIRTGQWGALPGSFIGLVVAIPISIWTLRTALSRTYRALKISVDVR